MRENDPLCVCTDLAEVDPDGVPCLRCQMLADTEPPPPPEPPEQDGTAA